MPKDRLDIRLTPELKGRVKAAADKRGQSVSALVVAALERALGDPIVIHIGATDGANLLRHIKQAAQ